MDVLGDGSGLKDGVYKAEMSEFENGWKDYVIAQVWHGNVVIVELDSLNESGTKKSADSSFAQSLKDNDKAPGDSVAVYLGKIMFGLQPGRRGSSRYGECSGRHHFRQ